MGSYIALSSISILIALGLGWQIQRRFSEKGSFKNFKWVMLAVAFWTLMAMLEVIVNGELTKILISKLSYIGIVSVPVFWLFFSYEYGEEDHVLQQKRMFLFWIIPVVTVMLVMTNEFHGLVWKSIYPDSQNPQHFILYYERGIWFVANSAYCYMLILLGMIRIFKTLRKNKTLKHHSIIFLGILAPLLGNIFYLTRIVSYDYAPAAFSFMCICFAWAIISGFFEKKMAIAETIYEHLDEAVFLLDDKLNIISMNPYAEKIFKLKNIGKSIPVASLFPFWKNFKQMHSKEKEEFYEVELEMDGAPHWFSVHRYAIGHKSQYPGWIISMFDITEKKRYEKELEMGRIAAEAANVAKSQFLANMSHEIRTPLNGIIGFTELLAGTAINSEQEDYLNEIKRASYSLFYLVNDILDFSKIEAEKMHFEQVEFSLSEMIASVIALGRPEAIKKGIDIFGERHDKVHDLLIGDPTRLKQVLNNLVGNAIKFTDKGYVKLLVKIAHETHEELSLRFEVADSGIGIAPDVQNKLFEVFTQADSSTTRKYGGTGLGLAISKKIVEHLGGRIWVESEEGKGSCFIFIVPLKKAEAKSTNTDVTGADSVSAENKTEVKTCRILLVEDIEANRKLAAILLKKLGHTCQIAVNGQEAADMCEREPFDLILMDCQMPVRDGYCATEYIRSHCKLNQETPIIAMTAHALAGDREKCIDAGMNDFITKPIDKKKLMEVLQKWS